VTSPLSPPPRLRVQPAGPFLIYLLLLAGLWYAGISQSSSIAYLLFFLLLSLGLVALLAGAENIRTLELRMVPTPLEGFADEGIPLRCILHNPSPSERPGLSIQGEIPSHPGGILPLEIEAIPPRDTLTLSTTARLPRGAHTLHEMRISTIYPLGLFRWTKRFFIQIPCIIYPAREGNAPLPYATTSSREGHRTARGSGDDFRGWRPYAPGDSSRHVDWKAVARGNPWLIKEFDTSTGGLARLDWNQTPGRDPDAKLSQLAQWLQTAGAQGWDVELHLPATTLTATPGSPQFRTALRHLAYWPETAPTGPLPRQP